ncbi:MAG: gamma-glutamyltransferase, partial [Chlorobiota bacterium]
MVVSADSLATLVGNDILWKNGNAVDAAVAVGFALAVTYPVAGNIGGGGFMVIREADGEMISFDYREKAPAGASRDMYLDADGNFIDSLAQEGVLSAGVPGSVAGMLDALEKYGTMSREEVIGPALQLARDGFKLPHSTASSFNRYSQVFGKYPSTAKIFTKIDSQFEGGELFRQPDLAITLERIIKYGKDGFYKGETSKIVSGFMEAHKGLITSEDMAGYESVTRSPVTGTYRGYKIISMAPPSSGGVALIQLLNILENADIRSLGHNSAEYVHYLTEAMRRVYADRSEYLGDPDFFNVPLNKLLSKNYAKQLFSQIDTAATLSKMVKPGLVNFNESLETTHYSVIDRHGNAVSVTTTINSGYGAKVVVEGAGFF